jgi:hypothetical protein
MAGHEPLKRECATASRHHAHATRVQQGPGPAHPLTRSRRARWGGARRRARRPQSPPARRLPPGEGGQEGIAGQAVEGSQQRSVVHGPGSAAHRRPSPRPTPPGPRLWEVGQSPQVRQPRAAVDAREEGVHKRVRAGRGRDAARVGERGAWRGGVERCRGCQGRSVRGLGAGLGRPDRALPVAGPARRTHRLAALRRRPAAAPPCRARPRP